MPVTKLRVATLLQACQKLESSLRFRGEVAGSIAFDLNEGVNTQIDLPSDLATRIDLIAHSPIPDPCPCPPWCVPTRLGVAQGIGQGAGEFGAVLEGLQAFMEQLPDPIRVRVFPQP